MEQVERSESEEDEEETEGSSVAQNLSLGLALTSSGLHHDEL